MRYGSMLKMVGRVSGGLDSAQSDCTRHAIRIDKSVRLPDLYWGAPVSRFGETGETALARHIADVPVARVRPARAAGDEWLMLDLDVPVITMAPIPEQVPASLDLDGSGDRRHPAWADMPSLPREKARW